ncbi:ABC transporter permease subunit (plasmid) [Ensifer adhaerens]|uniref:ABC transporter permease n=2 Tax=Ensifer adhaerens TaxID=106592 RepID=UPI001CC0D895|nr:ABC transporter permease subunit [Ensifer adhaerens]MBZ7927339.1 ABC transporter permease subunit [Ensifer adhaerens]UAX98348.1 ABC transporter permease subunit [Ensifer adhaerens]UAY05731.1 ABC transporter permease subunit [Ensifer adhaerens]UAY13109.1 ABC transporter permease subunit [Ensifer adhaerens]
MKRTHTTFNAPALFRAAAMPALVLLCIGAGELSPAVESFPQSWMFPVSSLINSALGWLVPTILPITSFVSGITTVLLAALVGTLQYLPWPAVAATVVLISFKAGGMRLMAISVGAIAYIVLTGFWQQSMATLSLVVLAVPLSVLIGFLLGLGAFFLPRMRRALELVFDFMQTFPAFAYLLPLLLLFGFGPIAGLIATAIYAVPPMARCTLSGLTEVPEERREVAEMSGCTTWQRLVWVELPSARPMMALGFNQTTMAALSMVITASIIGGFDDVGWAVLSGLRSADLGKSLMAGLVIVMISVVIDRITGGILGSARPHNAGRLNAGWRAILLSSAAIMTLGAIMRYAQPAVVSGWNEGRGIVDFQGLNQVLLAFVARYSDVLEAIKNAVLYYLVLPLRVGLSGAVLPLTWGFSMTPGITAAYGALAVLLSARQILRGRPSAAAATLCLAVLIYTGLVAFPWPAAIALAMWSAWRAAGLRLALFTGLSLGFVLVTGLWVPFVKSLYLVVVAVVLCAFAGGLIGIIAARSDRFSAIIRPVNDALQTMPQFVFLIPALMFFKVGEFAGLIAISLYAVVPAIRYTEAGLRSVSANLLETATQIGCTPLQSTLLVQLPTARPALLLGLNQVIMSAITMLPVAATVGTAELGQQIYIALGKADAGLGVTAGIVFCLLAINLDRILRGVAERLRGAH